MGNGVAPMMGVEWQQQSGVVSFRQAVYQQVRFQTTTSSVTNKSSRHVLIADSCSRLGFQ